MSTKHHLPYDWVKQIPSSLLEIDSAPLLGNAPSFPWEKFASELGSIFQIEEIAFQASVPEWKPANQILSGLSGSAAPLHFSIASLEGTGCWVMPKSDIATVMSLLMKEMPKFASYLDEEIKTAFHEFLAMEVIHTLSHIGFENSLTPQILEDEELPEGDSLCTDIAYTISGKTFKGRLILSSELQKSWRQRFLTSPQTVRQAAENVHLIVHLEGGTATLTKRQWSKVRKGDFLILDTCSIDPDLNKGKVVLTVKGTPLFRGMIKNGNLKILENPLYHEVDKNMNESLTPDEESEFEEFEESEFDEDEYDEDEDEYEDAEDSENEEEAEEEEEVVAKAEEAPSASGIADASEIPLSIVVEIARLQMSIKQLNELQPGNLLELNISPEDGVDLVVNGKRIARAELLRVGGALSARILEIG